MGQLEPEHPKVNPLPVNLLNCLLENSIELYRHCVVRDVVFQKPLHDFRLPIRYLKDWFPDDEAISKRRAIRRLIASLTRRLNPSLDYDPRQDGCDVDDDVDS